MDFCKDTLFFLTIYSDNYPRKATDKLPRHHMIRGRRDRDGGGGARGGCLGCRHARDRERESSERESFETAYL